MLRAVIALLPRPRVLRVDGGWGPRKSRGHLGLRILESYSRRKEPSGPKRARPLPRGVYASAVSLKPLGSRTKIRLSLGKVQPLSCLRRSRQRDPPIRSGNVTPTGEAAELGEHDALCEPGPGIWPLRLAKCQRWGEDGRSPGLRTFLQLRRDKIKAVHQGPACDARASMRVFRHSLTPVRHRFPYRRRSAEAFLARRPGSGRSDSSATLRPQLPQQLSRATLFSPI